MDKRRRWPRALLVGFLTALAGAILSFPVSDWAMQAHEVSNFEGQRSVTAAFLFLPLAFLLGAVVGVVVSLQWKGAGMVGYFKAQGVALLGIAGIIGAAGGFAYLSADHPPLVDGKALALEIEARVPRKKRSIAELEAAGFNMALVVSASDRSYADLRWSEATAGLEFITVPVWARLNSRNANREITAHTGDESPQAFPVPLPASPKVNEAWSEWVKPRAQRYDESKIQPEDAYQVRYRVRFTPEIPDPATIPEAAVD